MSTFSILATPRADRPSPRILTGREQFDRNPANAERPKWQVLSVIRHWANEDIDWWRKKFGKAMGEAAFFNRFQPDSIELVPGNMLLANGASALWQCLFGNGTTTANTGLATPTFFNSAQTQLYVGDASVATGTGTVTLANNSTSLTFGTSQSGLIGKYFVSTGDSTNSLNLIVSGSGLNWTLATAYQGTALSASPATWYTLQSENHSQTALSAGANIAHQAMDSTFPSNPSTAQLNAITGATTGGVLSMSSGDISTNDIVQVFELQGITGLNGMWVANPASAGSVTLLGATGSGTYVSGFGFCTKRTVAKFQATFGTTTANFAWWEWGVSNGTGGNLIMLNRKCFNGGTKSGGTTSFQVGIGLG